MLKRNLDRIRLKWKRNFFFEIKNPEYMDKRRKEIGLAGIESFAKERGIEWNITQNEK